MSKETLLAGKVRILLGLLVVVYLILLPDAISLFNFLLNIFGLTALKYVSLILLLVLLVMLIQQSSKKALRSVFFSILAPFVLIMSLLATIESNPIKYLHIPEYFLMAVLMYFLIQESENELLSIVSAVVCSTLLGVVDEFHHGIHPDRYFGWRDMVINAAGSFIGALFLVQYLRNNDKHLYSKVRSTKASFINVSMLILSLVITVLSIYVMLRVVEAKLLYSSNLLALNGLVIGITAFSVARRLTRYETSPEYNLLFFWPNTVLLILHMMIVLVVVSNIAFR